MESDEILQIMKGKITMRKSISLILGVIILGVYVPIITTNANSDYWLDHVTEVKPSSNNVYEIRTAEHLAWIAMKCNAAVSYDFQNCTVILLNDLDLSGKEWTPIGGFIDVDIHVITTFKKTVIEEIYNSDGSVTRTESRTVDPGMPLIAGRIYTLRTATDIANNEWRMNAAIVDFFNGPTNDTVERVGNTITYTYNPLTNFKRAILKN